MPATSDVTVVGITDAGPASLLPEARAAVDRASLLCGGERHLAFFPDHPGRRFTVKANIDALIECLRETEEPAAVLASGDPCFYGIGPLLAARLGQDRVRIIPNVSSVQVALARLGLAQQDAAVVTAHGRSIAGVLPAALHSPLTVILTDPHNTPAVIARALLDAGSDNVEAHVFEHLGGREERHVSGCLQEIAGMTFAPLNLMVIRRPAVRRMVQVGMPDQAFAHREGMITKAEVRAISLSRLSLPEDGVLWDIGAGCGSVAIEAALLAPRSRVYAIERDERQQEYARENARRFRAPIEIVPGAAPHALAGLPRPDRVFIGGSGGALSDILCHTMSRLAPSGRVVLNLVTLEHLHEALQVSEKAGWTHDVTQISVARSASTAGLTRLAALNPVFVVTLTRQEEPQ